MDSTGEIKTREREEAKLRGSVVKGERPRRKALLNAIKLINDFTHHLLGYILDFCFFSS